MRPVLAPDEVRRYLEHLPDWWRDADPEDRRALAVTLVERISVLGVNRVWVEPTQEALHHGLADAFGPDEVEMVGARGFSPTQPTSSRRPLISWRDEHPNRTDHATMSAPILVVHAGPQLQVDGAHVPGMALNAVSCHRTCHERSASRGVHQSPADGDLVLAPPDGLEPPTPTTLDWYAEVG